MIATDRRRPRFAQEISARTANKMRGQPREPACPVADGVLQMRFDLAERQRASCWHEHRVVTETLVPARWQQSDPVHPAGACCRPPADQTTASSDQAPPGTGVRNWWRDVLAGLVR